MTSKFCPRIVGVAILSMAVAALIVAAAGPEVDRASAAGRFAHCGSQHVARHYWKHWSHGNPDHRFEGWRCSDRQVGEELWKGRCNRTLSSGLRQKVRFEFGF